MGSGNNQRELGRSASAAIAASASVMVIGIGLGTASCGGGAAGGSAGATPRGSTRDGGSATSDGGASVVAASLPSGLPAMAPMPPPGVAGSKKARKKIDAALYACGGGAKPSAKDPADLVKRLGDACATAAKMKPVGAMIRAQQADRDAHQEHRLRVEANHCYRVVFATEEAVHDAVVVMRDSAGDMVGESAGAALPDDGALCFTMADEVTLMIGVGAGKGAYAAQVWSD